jgi:hypothetical protein
VARCRVGAADVEVLHGEQVEIAQDWFSEAAWDGDFGAGDFDRTDIVAGSAGRLRDGHIVFVSAGATVDRLHTLTRDGMSWVSNTLPGLLRVAGATLDPAYPAYYQTLYSVVRGIRCYTQSLPTSAGELRLVYFNNVVWDGCALRIDPKPVFQRDFSSFARYRDFMEGTFARVAANLASKERHAPYRLLGTLSSGYDSTTVATLARQVGCEEVLCFDRAWLGHDRAAAIRDGSSENDSGAATAGILGLRAIVVELEGWRSLPSPEIPFLAANGMGEEVRFATAASHLHRRCLTTGYHGDKVWSKTLKDSTADLVRGDPSGSALGEYRLWAGFLHCPVPFWGARQIADLHAITLSPEMAAWDVPGTYSRPICRRIVESAGVPRNAFGTRKLAASVMRHDDPQFLTPESLARYLEWLRVHRGAWLRRGQLPPVRSLSLDNWVLHTSDSLAESLRRMPVLWRLAQSANFEYGPTRLRRALFPWAVEGAMRHYAFEV